MGLRMNYTYTEYFAILDHELQQEQAGGDRGTPDKFRLLPSTQSKRVINETLFYFASLNPSQYNREQILEPRSLSTPSAIEDDVIYLEYDSGVISVPDRIFRVDAVFANSIWNPLYDSSNLNSDWYSPNKRTLKYRPDNLTSGVQILFHASVFPKRLKDNRIWTSIDVSSTLFPIVSYNKVGIGAGHGLEIGDSFTISDTTDFNGIVTVIGVSDDYVYVDSSISASPTTQAATITLNTDDLEIDIPMQYYPMLTLEIKKRRYARKGKLLSQPEYAQLMLDTKRWSSERGQVKQTANFSMRGWGHGKR